MNLPAAPHAVGCEDVAEHPFFHDLVHIGPREQRALKKIVGTDSGNWVTLAIDIYHGIAGAIRDFAHEQGCSDEAWGWICLDDYPQAQCLLGLNGTGRLNELKVSKQFLSEVDNGGNLGDAYCSVLPPDLRHRLGEHYTPDWLVARMVQSVACDSVVADPACGDGRFLSALIRSGHPADKIWGLELNPLAVMMARYGTWDAAGRPAKPACRIEWCDFLLNDHYAGMSKIEALASPDILIGNPPWVTWRTIPPGYRRHIAKHWSHSSLNTLRGWNARVSAGQTDLCHLFIHEAIERASSNGRVAFVLPRSTFKGPVGSAPIRSGVSSSGRCYGYHEVWEIDTSDAFSEVRSDTVVAFLAVDTPQVFPVPWREIRKDARRPTAEHGARPTDEEDLNSSWLTRSDVRALQLAPDQRPATLRARGGINTGGANSIFHLRVIRQTGSGITVENILSRTVVGDVAAIRAVVEPEFVRPLLRGRQIKPWRSEPGDAILVPHDPSDLRRVVRSDTLQKEMPQTWRYLQRFEPHLRGRKELARWGGEWYALFRIGSYTAGCWRVVWPHSSGQNLRAAVLAPNDPTVPDQKVVLLSFNTEHEALFYCALINSDPVRQLVRGTSGLDASPNVVRRVVLPEVNVADARHAAVVEYARAAVADPGQADASQLDALAWTLYS